MDEYQALVTRIYDAVVESARWGSDARSHLLERLEEILLELRGEFE